MTHAHRWTSFFRQFVRHPNVVGAVAPSSRFLARKMVEGIDWESVRAIVEYGPGTGSLTEQILKKIPPHCRYIGIEFSPEFARIFRSRYPGLRLYEDSVSNVKKICEREGVSSVDCVVSGLPWASFSSDAQSHYLVAMKSVLRGEGTFVTFAYLQGLLLPAGQRFRKTLRGHFDHVSTSRIVWLNLPPAFIYRCR